MKVVSFKIFHVICLPLMLSHCSKSMDLGAEKPIEVSFTSAEPTWEGGVGEVFKLKCANCHTSPTNRSVFVPSNTPASVNGISRSSFFEDSALAGLVFDRMFSDSVNPMPPDFATPLTDAERANVRTWLETKTVAIETLCGATGTSALSFDDVKSTLSNDCSSCHNGVDQSSFGTLDQTKLYRRTMLTYLNNGTMPPTNSSYKSSTAGAALYNWLCFGDDVQ